MGISSHQHPCRHWSRLRRRWGPADVRVSEKHKCVTMVTGGQIDTKWRWASGIPGFGPCYFEMCCQEWIVFFAQQLCDCFVLWLRLFPRALSFPHCVSSKNIISFRQSLLYFNLILFPGIISPPFADESTASWPMDASTPALQLCSTGSSVPMILLLEARGR